MLTFFILLGIALAMFAAVIYMFMKRIDKKKLEGQGTPTETPPPPAK